MPHARFRFRTVDELVAGIQDLGVDVPADGEVTALTRSVVIGRGHAPNALAVQPMEGCDGTAAGAPGELTVRRYLRFARGGAGLLWFEATAVAQEGRANPRQLYLTPHTADEFTRLHEQALSAAREVNGSDREPYTVLQLTHSGRYSRPVDRPTPILAHHDGVLDQVQRLSEDHPLISDEALDRLRDRYVDAAKLAYRCGFRAVDIKSCHRYLLSELLGAHTRPGRYGGSFENRSRMLLSVVRGVRDRVPDLDLAVRLNVYDGHPYPWGWGVDQADPGVEDLSEPLKLIGLLKEAGVALINVTAGNPYFTPHINRPFDANVTGGYTPEEHPLQGVARLIGLAREVKRAHPDLVVLGTGYSWLRQFLGNVASAVVRLGWADMAGVGRGAIAYPDFARDLLTQGVLDPKKCCITCSRCTQIMRDHGTAGCVPFDRDVYGPIYEAAHRQP